MTVCNSSFPSAMMVMFFPLSCIGWLSVTQAFHVSFGLLPARRTPFVSLQVPGLMIPPQPNNTKDATQLAKVETEGDFTSNGMTHMPYEPNDGPISQI